MNLFRSMTAILPLAFCSITVIGQTTARSHSTVSEQGALQLRDGWAMQSSRKVDQIGELISTLKFQPNGWYSVSVPTTVVAALVKQKVYPDPEFGMNLRKFPGVDYPIGANFSEHSMRQDSPFMVPWWFRKEFALPASFKGKTLWLDFGGINYRANIFLNGKQIGKYEDVAGAWRTYEFNITDAALIARLFSIGEKSLAITFVDWYPAPPDKNMGMFRNV